MIESLFITPELRVLGDHGLSFSAGRDPLRGAVTVVARLGGDEASQSWTDAAIAERDGAAEGLLSFLHGLPHRFRASYARPAEPWPDCLPPMFATPETTIP